MLDPISDYLTLVSLKPIEFSLYHKNQLNSAIHLNKQQSVLNNKETMVLVEIF